MNYDPKRLKKFFQEEEIEVVLFDLDDTLLETHNVFVQTIHSLLEHLSSKLEIDYSKLRKEFEAEVAKAHYTAVVNPPKLWQTVVSKCEKAFGWEDAISQDSLKILMSIYTKLPKVLPGAIPTLEELKAQKRYLGLVTHATSEWTNFKLEGLDLARFFEHIELFDVNIHKNKKAWKSAIEAFKVKPKNALVVGDNVKGDIQAAHEAGVKNLVWVNRDEGWDLYKEGELPKGTVVIGGINELLENLCKRVG